MEFNTTVSRRTQSCTALVVTALLSACAGTPYVRLEAPDTSTPPQAPSLPSSIRYAEGVQAIYRDKLIELGDAERQLANGLIGLGALALGLGISGSHSSAIQGVALIGGTAYTLGNFNTDKRRPAVYGAGIEALNCATAAVAPLNFTEAMVTRINTMIDDQRGARTRVQDLINKVLALVSAVEASGEPNPEALSTARAAVTAAQASLTRATDADKAADHLLIRRDRAGGDLRNAVMVIDAQVLNAIRSTEVDVRAVPAALAQLASNSQVFSDTSGGTIKMPAPSAKNSENGSETLTNLARKQQDLRAQLDDALFQLTIATADLDNRSARLAGIVARVDGDTTDRLKACKMEGIILPITLSTSTVTFKEKTAGLQIVDITGGQRNTYRAEFTVQPHPGLTVRIPRSSDTLEIQATAATVAGSYPIRVDDATLQSTRIVTVQIPKAD